MSRIFNTGDSLTETNIHREEKINMATIKTPRIDWNRNMLTNEAYNPNQPMISDDVAEAKNYEKPVESRTTNIAPQTGDEGATEVFTDGRKVEDPD